MRRLLLFAGTVAGTASLLLAPTAGAWTWPASGGILQPFVFDHAHPYASGQHRGVDIAADTGATVVAPVAGTVSFAGSVPSSGKSVTIETADGYSVTLTHLGSIAVGKDAVVAEGDALGTVGPSGDPEVTQPYVHLGVRRSADAQGYVDPLTLLPARPTTPVQPAPSAPAPPALPVAAQPVAGQPAAGQPAAGQPSAARPSATVATE